MVVASSQDSFRTQPVKFGGGREDPDAVFKNQKVYSKWQKCRTQGAAESDFQNSTVAKNNETRLWLKKMINNNSVTMAKPDLTIRGINMKGKWGIRKGCDWTWKLNAVGKWLVMMCSCEQKQGTWVRQSDLGKTWQDINLETWKHGEPENKNIKT